MRTYERLLLENKAWAAEKIQDDPEYFSRLAHLQTPEFLWIGCSDSRVPANEITGTHPGEIFVHRNIANMVVHTDLNMLSVLQYAVEVLKVKHVIVCGHYGCGGVKAALGNSQLGLIDNWLRHIKDVWSAHQEELSLISDESLRLDRLCELNVRAQVFNICHTTVVQQAWRKGQSLSVHGWIYGIDNGLIRDLGLCLNSPDEITEVYRMGKKR